MTLASPVRRFWRQNAALELAQDQESPLKTEGRAVLHDDTAVQAAALGLVGRPAEPRFGDVELTLRSGTRTIISFTSTSAGCSIANAMARAIALGSSANLSRDSASWAFTSGFVTVPAKFVRTK